MEVRFPPGSRYPYEAPFVYLKTTCHDIPHELRLRYARHLYREAREICRDGIPCVYSICDLLQSNEQLAGRLDTAAFPSPKRSLFHDEPEGAGADADGEGQQALKPSHYARGQTSRNEEATSAMWRPRRARTAACCSSSSSGERRSATRRSSTAGSSCPPSRRSKGYWL